MKPYRPSNGTDGEIFHSRFCHRCKHEGPDGAACDIAMRAFFFGLADPEYPKEWVIEENDPLDTTAKCTAFEEKP